MRKMVGFISVVVLALVLVASPGYAIAGVTGQANSDNTILKVQVGNTVVKLGTDLADSFNTSILKSTGQFITGTIGAATLSGGASRTATNASQSGSKNIGTGTKSVAGLANLTISSGKIANAISATKVSSAVDFALANINALAGFTNIGTTNSSTDSVVGKSSSVVSRDVSIGDVDVLDLGTLLDQLGVNPLAMACAAIEDVGATLGVDTSAACATLSSVTSAIGVGSGEIDALETVTGTLSTALNLLCTPVELVTPGYCDSAQTQIASVLSTIDSFQADPATACSAFDDAIATITGAADTVVTTLNGLSGGALGDLTALIAPVTSQLDAVDTALATVNSTCSTLLGIVEGLLDTPLLSLDLVSVGMDLVADTSPTSAVNAAIGALKVGNLTVVDANDLIALGSQLNAAIDTVESTLGGVLSATGLDLPMPVLDLLKVTKSAGKSNGLYFAKGALSVAHIGLPSAVVDLPATLPLDVLGGLGGFAPLAVQAAAVTTPAVAVDAGVFSGEATYAAAPGANPGGDQLPNTGVADSGLAFIGMLTLIGAGFLRRVAKVF
ncbi:MAG: LPXTG cell wall anchor domain-containing protein [Actinomycetota bacterium]